MAVQFLELLGAYIEAVSKSVSSCLMGLFCFNTISYIGYPTVFRMLDNIWITAVKLYKWN